MARKSRTAHVQTTYSQRVAETLGLFCTETPPLDMVQSWCFSDDDALQQWVLTHLRLSWAQGIGAIDAARCMADLYEEGCLVSDVTFVSDAPPLHFDEAHEREAYQKANGTWVEPITDPVELDNRDEGKLLPLALGALESLANTAAVFPEELSKDHPDVVNAFTVVARGKVFLG